MVAQNTKPLKSDGWALFDAVVGSAPLRRSSPWRKVDGLVVYEPDYETLKMLLRVPQLLGSAPTSGLPALALDVWVAYELRRAGFAPDAVWPRDSVPRILPGPIVGLLENMTKSDAAHLRRLLTSGKTFGGTVGASAKVLGKHYMKQVDVVISNWDTGPELLISTKRMDDSYANNAPNRIEESYGDAKNLRSRHPQAALGFVFALRADAFTEAPRAAAWILDLLAKLGREDDAYDAVALVVPKYAAGGVKSKSGDSINTRPEVEVELLPPPEEEPMPTDRNATEQLLHDLYASPPVDLDLDVVPTELSPARFLERMINQMLDHSPITRHTSARGQVSDAHDGR